VINEPDNELVFNGNAGFPRLSFCLVQFMKPHSRPTLDVWPRAQPMEQPMPSRLLTAVVFVGAVLFGSAMADADPLPSPVTSPVTTVPQAPIGHLQPRAHPISPSAPAEEIEQQRLSTFDAEQQKLDQQLDKSLNICRC
jgi:hypothetical protein